MADHERRGPLVAGERVKVQVPVHFENDGTADTTVGELLPGAFDADALAALRGIG